MTETLIPDQVANRRPIPLSATALEGQFEYLELAMSGEYWADSLGEHGRGELMGRTAHHTPAKRLQELGSEGWALEHVFADNLDFRFYIFRRPRLA